MTRNSEVAAEWWANAISGDVKKDNGDSLTTLIAVAYKDTVDKHEPTVEQLSLFKRVLTRLIDKKTINLSKDGYPTSITLGVDYGPDQDLVEAANAADINVVRFPWKTIMWIYDNKVVVKHGYAADHEVIWENG